MAEHYESPHGRSIAPDKYYEFLSANINSDLANAVSIEFPPNLYDPMRYALSSKGKRFRPVLLIMSCEAAGGDLADAYNAAIAIEILHNFTLVHDDIMDNDMLRRGKETVHKKWNSNIAILAGDGLIALAYRFLLKTESDNLKEVVKIFSEAIIKICEGQSLDKDMETTDAVTSIEYLDMIKRKTGVLMSISAEIGGILGKGGTQEIEALKKFGFELGIAFQIQDDLMDIISEEGVIGKDLGSDLILGKKTYPIIEFLECASVNESKILKNALTNRSADAAMIKKVKNMLHDSGVVKKTGDIIGNHIDYAISCINGMSATLYTDHLIYLSEMIRNRTN